MKSISSRYATAAATLVATATLIFAGSLIKAPRVHADDNDRDHDESKARIGFEIAPVVLDLHGKDRHLVGLGSYIVNAGSDCNGCHTAAPSTEYIPSGNPYLLHAPGGPFRGKKEVNSATYLGGGSDFGPLIPGSAHIISRNLTPDRTGLPAGHTFAEFYQIMRSGVDFDRQHPTCPAPPGSVGLNCVPFPFNGDRLQVMPWPAFQDMTDRDLRAIYEYLRALPCVAGPTTGPLHNDCP